MNKGVGAHQKVISNCLKRKSRLNNIGRISTGGVVTEYGVPTANSLPYDITAGPDGALWFTEFDGLRIGRVTTTWAFAEYPVPTDIGAPGGIASASDGSLWFTGSALHGYLQKAIGQVAFVTAGLAVSPASGPYNTSLTFSGDAFSPNETVTIYRGGIGSAALARATADDGGSFRHISRACLVLRSPVLSGSWPDQWQYRSSPVRDHSAVDGKSDFRAGG